MEKALIVSNQQKNIDYFTFMLNSINVKKIISATTCLDARNTILNNEFDICIVDSPLKDELGKNLSIHIAKNSITQVVFCVDLDVHEKLSDEVSRFGVIPITKPFDRKMFLKYLNMCVATSAKLKKLNEKNKKLSATIEDIKIVDRAKCLLISYLNMTEPEAHKYIEKQAMDTRQSKRVVATNILRTYEN